MEIINAKLTSMEKQWLSKLLSVDFPWREDIIRQISTADIFREYTEYYLSLQFCVHEVGNTARSYTGVPIEMLVYSDEEAYPIEFLLHVKDGLVSELEIYRVDLMAIRPNIDLAGKKVEIIIENRGDSGTALLP